MEAGHQSRVQPTRHITYPDVLVSMPDGDKTTPFCVRVYRPYRSSKRCGEESCCFCRLPRGCPARLGDGSGGDKVQRIVTQNMSHLWLVFTEMLADVINGCCSDTSIRPLVMMNSPAAVAYRQPCKEARSCALIR